MHKLGSRLFFSSFLVYLAEQTSRRVTASHRHCVHALCLTCGLHVHSRCACVRTRVHTHPASGFPGCHLAWSCGETPGVFLIGDGSKQSVFVFLLGWLFCFVFVFDLFF